jgi:hypothetical protein
MTDTKMIPLHSILRLVEYLEHDEGKHWEAMRAAGEDALNHIFNDVTAVSDWLSTQLLPAAAGGRVADGDFAEFWAERDAAKRH